MIDIKKLQEEYEFSITDQSPLTIKSYGDTFKGEIAQMFLEDMQKTYEEDNSNFNSIEEDAKYLVTASPNWADEFDFNEFMVMSGEDLKNFTEKLSKYEDSIEWYFGTNEEMSYSNGAEMLEEITWEKISDEEGDILDKLFGGSFDGGCGFFSNASEIISDEDNDNEDEELSASERKLLDELVTKWGYQVKLGDDYDVEIIDSEGNKSNCSTYYVFDFVKYLRRKK